MSKILIDYLEILTESIVSTLNSPEAYLNKIALSAIVLILVSLLYFLFNNVVAKNIKSYKQRYTFKNY